MRRSVVVAGILIVVALAGMLLLRDRTPSRPSNTGSSGTKSGHRSARGEPASATSNIPFRRVAGTVYLDDLRAAGATVRLVPVRGAPDRSAETDARGQFDLGSVPVDAYHVVAEVPHATGVVIAIDLRDPLAEVDKLRLVAHACDASLHGLVRDASGGTIAKARILVTDDMSVGPGVDAGDDGTYDVCVPFGESRVVVRADGYADAHAWITAFGRLHRDFQLVPEAIVAGRTVRSGDGSPVANAVVIAQADDALSWQRVPMVSAVSDADGRFTLRGIGGGRYRVTATANHLASAEPVQVIAELGAPAKDIVCTLAPALSLSGGVVDKRTAKPIPDVPLVVSSPDASAELAKSATTRSDGTFVVENLLPGEYQVHARMYVRAAPVKVTLDNDDVHGLTIEVDALSSIAGRVTRLGKAVDGAQVHARPADQRQADYWPTSTATTDVDGRFVLRGLQAGSYRVYAESKRVGAFTPGPTVTLRDGEDKTGLEVEMNLAGSIAGGVVDQNGVPVAGAHLRFSLLQGTDFGEATTATDGTFKASALSGGGNYIYEVRPTPASPVKFRPAANTRFTPIAVRDADTHVTGVQIKVQFQRLSIAGRVMSSEGTGVPDAVVTAGEPRMGGLVPTATTDASGAFVLADLPAGRYTLSASSSAGSRRLDAVRAGTRNVEIRLPALGTIHGTVEGFTEKPSVFAIAMDDPSGMSPYRATVTGTAFSIKDLPAGRYQLMANAKDGYAETSTTIDAKKTVRVVLRNAGFGSIEGRVSDANGAVADLWCFANRDVSARTDASGAFRMERVSAGNVTVSCFNKQGEASASVTVERGSTARVELTLKERRPRARGYSGLELEAQLSDVLVKAVAASSPAERAGIKVGDVVREVDGRELNGFEGPRSALAWIEMRDVGSMVELTLERDGQQQTVELKLEAPR